MLFSYHSQNWDILNGSYHTSKQKRNVTFTVYTECIDAVILYWLHSYSKSACFDEATKKISAYYICHALGMIFLSSGDFFSLKDNRYWQMHLASIFTFGKHAVIIRWKRLKES